MRRQHSDIRPSEITSERVYRSRRELLKGLALALPALATGCTRAADGDAPATSAPAPADGTAPLAVAKRGAFSTDEPQTSRQDATHYNNYYEFGTGKADPAANSGRFRPRPWSVEIAGHADVTGTFALDDLLKNHPLEERVYRMRCVEAWSMVIPWVGFPLANLIKRCEPTAKAKYVEFTTLNDPGQMPGQRNDVLDWPYVEGLRMDEALHPLATLAVGIYGEVLPTQNGAPLRLVVPWKYGFKGAKSIVRIRFVEKQPITSWMRNWPQAYGFYSNVNPAVNHPRHSQAMEVRLPSLARNRRTQLFNGYGEQVASLYKGMDLTKLY